MEDHWRIEMLGGLRIRHGATVVTRFRTYKVAALLAYLALNPHRHHDREGLTDRFWPDADVEAARASLRTALSLIRRLLEEGGQSALIAHGNHSISLDTTRIRTDVSDFEAAIKARQWEQARRLYTGPLLPGFYDDWVLRERERLEEVAETAFSHAEAAVETAPALQPSALLPPETTRFFGREEELHLLMEQLGEARLITLIGPGGIGKTRLALTAARRYSTQAKGIAFVPLSEIMDARYLLVAIRDALALPGEARTTPLEQIVTHLDGKPFLLVLDNFEQLSAGGAAVVRTLLTRLSLLTCLVTSRRRLGLPWERTFPVRPLTEEVSVPLFVERAQSVHPQFRMTASNATVVAELCRDLEGIPLAIELAAARAQSLSLVEMRDRLIDARTSSERFAFLSTRRQDKSARQRSLWTTIDWSYRLLTPEQQRLFSRLSVFRGGWTTEAAAEVCQEPFALEYLAQLRERSLIEGEERDDTIRWRMLETLREFATEQLTPDAREELTQRHVSCFLALTETAYPHLQNRDASWLRRIDGDNDNIRAALPMADPATRLYLCANYWRYWENRSYFEEGRIQLRTSLSAAPPEASPLIQARAWTGLGVLAYHQGDHAEAENALTAGITVARNGAREQLGSLLNNLGLLRIRQNNLEEARLCLTEAVEILTAQGNGRGISSARMNLGIIAFRSGKLDDARGHYEAVLASDRAGGNLSDIAYTLNNLGNLHNVREDWDVARACHEESLSLKRTLGDRSGEASSLNNLGVVALQQRRLNEAEVLNKEALRLRQELGLQAGIYESFVNLGEIALMTGTAERATILWGAADALLSRLHMAIPAQQRQDQEAAYASARSTLGDASFNHAFAAGRALSLDTAIAFALSNDSRPAP